MSDVRLSQSHLVGSADGPIFVLCTSRSGSTLLRYFLDAHPDLCCPAETNIAAMFDAIRFAAGVVLPPDSTGDVAAYDICRLTARELFKPYLQRENKRRWCDKSLSSIDTAESLARIFPDARFICLYRDFRDVVASTLEACPFGVAGYGLDPYVQDTPGNSVLAIARYWADKVETMLAFEAQHPHEACRVRYEDFVADPMDEQLLLTGSPRHKSFTGPTCEDRRTTRSPIRAT
jgi:protein-tyrosine sulfotransferase